MGWAELRLASFLKILKSSSKKIGHKPQFTILDVLLDGVEGGLPVDFKLGSAKPRDFHDHVHCLGRRGRLDRNIWVGGFTSLKSLQVFFVKSTQD